MSSSQSSHWIERAERALQGQEVAGTSVVGHHSPPIFDSEGIRAATAPFFAAFMWVSAALRAEMTGHGLDWLSLLLHLLALSLTVRTLLSLQLIGRRLRLRIAAHRYGLAITEEGLLIRTPSGDVAVPRQDVVAVKEPAALRERSGHYQPVYLITQPRSGRTHVALPPVLDHSPRALAERLMRWLGPVGGPSEYTPPAPTELPSKVYDAAATGKAPQVLALRHGAAWLRRGPYATVLMGLAIAVSYLQLDAGVRARLGATAPLLVIFALLFVPLLWAVLVRIDIAPRKGLSLVLTPAEVMMRTRAGVHVIPMADLRKASVTSHRTWSLLLGVHEVRSLLLEPESSDSVSYVESFLGTPAEVVVGLCEGFKKGVIRSVEE